jgi:hypothetical protein
VSVGKSLGELLLDAGKRIVELERYEARMKWLHDCTHGNLDDDGYEWGVYRVKWENGRAVEVWQTNADFSDLDAEMERERNSQNEPTLPTASEKPPQA